MLKIRLLNRFTSFFKLILVCCFLWAFCLQTDPQGNFRKYVDADIPFVYETHNSTPPEWVTAIDAGAQVWEDVPSSYWEFENGGFTAASSVARDGVNLVFFDQQGVNFGPPGSNIIAFSSTFTAGSGASYRAVESDYIFNARDFPPGLNGEFGQQDLQGVSAHEFGHHIGIMHTGPAGNGGQMGCGPSFPSATMYAFSAPGDTTSRSLHFDDMAGAAYLYPNWILRGNVNDALSGQPLPGAALVSEVLFAASLIGPVEFSGAWYQVPGAAGIVPIGNDGSYYAASLLQQYAFEVKLYGYLSQTSQVAFNPPGGIGQTQTIIRNFSLTASPQVQLSGAVVDSQTGALIPADIEIFAVSDKPGVPLEPVAVISSNSGEFSAMVPAEEDFRIDVMPLESPYPLGSQVVENVPLAGIQVNVPLSPAEVMLVDDDQNAAYETYFKNALANINRTYYPWEVASDGVPPAAEIEKFPQKIIVWYTGDGLNSTLTEAEQNILLNHLDTGGKLFLTGQNIAEQLNGSPLLNRLGIAFQENVSTPLVLGVKNDIADGWLFSTSGSGGANNQTSRDRLSISDPAQTRAIFQYGNDPASIAGTAMEFNAARAIFLGFGWEAIGNNTAREAMLDIVLTYLGAAVTGIATADKIPAAPLSLELLQNYPNPFNPSTHIDFTLNQTGKVTLEVYNAAGQKIATLVNGLKNAGKHTISFQAEHLASGIYFYTIASGNVRKTRTMVLIR